MSAFDPNYALTLVVGLLVVAMVVVAALALRARTGRVAVEMVHDGHADRTMLRGSAEYGDEGPTPRLTGTRHADVALRDLGSDSRFSRTEPAVSAPAERTSLPPQREG